MKKKNECTRRNFLKASLSAPFAVPTSSYIVGSVLTTIVSNAMAQDSNPYDKKYIHIAQRGAPPRWMFDLALTPDGDSSNFIAAQGVGNKYTGSSRYTGVTYQSTLVNGLHMPWMWSYSIPTSNGGSVPMSNLMDGMLSIRGVDTNNPAHQAAQALHLLPSGISKSLSSLTAEKSDLPIQAVNMGVDQFSLKSPEGLSAVKIDNLNNGLQQLMLSFKEIQSDFYKNEKSKVSALLESAMSLLNGQATNLNPKSETLKKNMANAIELFSKDFGDLDAVFNQLVTKYRNLISRSIDPSSVLAGISDKPIGTSGNRNNLYLIKGDGSLATNSDIRTIITNESKADDLAKRFAITEFIILNNLSSSVSLNARGLTNLSISNNSASQGFDEHNFGVIPSVILNTKYNLALSACLYEFISQLKANNMYDQCVIDLGGEFGRKPRNDGGGSDHSAEAKVINLFSGSINGSHVIGNIKAQAGGRNGTWGYGAFNPSFGLLNLGHFTSTLSHILGVPSPVTASPSLVKEENGKFVPLLPTGKIVA